MKLRDEDSELKFDEVARSIRSSDSMDREFSEEESVGNQIVQSV